MWSYGLDLRSIKLTFVKVIVSSEGTCNNCLFVEMCLISKKKKHRVVWSNKLKRSRHSNSNK